MLYTKNKEKTLSDGLFKNPTAEYRSTPFWAWNADLNREELARQIDEFSQMGFGGFHMHVRQGLESEYLGEDFLDAVKFCTERAKEKGMYAWLYDEDRWPSGVAGGFVTQNIRHRQKYLEMKTKDIPDTAADVYEARETGKSCFMGAFSVAIDREGKMLSYKRVMRDEDAENKRYFFLSQRQGGEPRYNYQTYVDAMSKEAIDEFINLTHEGFKRAVGKDFGGAVPAIFTDEPQVYGYLALNSGFDRSNAACSWTTDFADTYKKTYGEDILERLPELFFATDLPEAKATLFNYYTHVSERFCEAYLDNIGDWCEKNGIALTGHVIGEDNLYEMALNNADVMRTYKRMQMPGVDVLCDDVVFNTPIQCRSVTRQYGREATMSELYGVTGWDFDFRGHKYQGDWQAALGVNVRVPHLAWQTMKGEGKRDYPASISYQSAWYKEYKYLEDHYARINTAMTRGVPEVNIAVIHPIDSYNIMHTSKAETVDERVAMDARFKETYTWLLSELYDFDYISESLLPELCQKAEFPLAVGKMRYDAVIVADCKTLRAHTIEILEQFKRLGGKLIIMGEAPSLCCAKPSGAASELSVGARVIPHSRAALRAELSDLRKIDMKDRHGVRTRNFMCTIRRDGDFRWIFGAHMFKPELSHLIKKEELTVTVDGCYKPMLYDTLSGEIRPLAYRAGSDKTEFDITLYDLDTLLVRLEPTECGSSLSLPVEKDVGEELYHPSLVDYKLDEPNVLVMDMARYSLDGGEMSEYEEEILRIDAAVRAKLGLMERKVKFVQPWAIDGSPEDHTLRLVYTLRSDISVRGAMLAMENAKKAKITLNGKPVSNKTVGYYIDRYVNTVSLPAIKKGENTLVIEMPFGLRTDLEACYVIGDFGTAYVGREARITKKPEKLHFGSVVEQGLSFYGANIEYEAKITLPSDGEIEIVATHYRGAVINVSIDGKDLGRIAFQPFSLRSKKLSAGEHTVTYKLFGTRYNTLTALHNLNADKHRMYIGPIYWRSEGEAWAYEYQTRPMGILKTPVVRFYKNENR